MAVTVAGDEGNIVAPWKITVVYRVSVDRPPALRRPWAPGIAIYSDPAPAQVCIHALEITKGMLFGWCMSQTIMAWLVYESDHGWCIALVSTQYVGHFARNGKIIDPVAKIHEKEERVMTPKA